MEVAMSNQTQSKHLTGEPEAIGGVGLIVRIIWIMGGNMALFMLAVLAYHKGALSGLDVAYWAIVVGLIVIRYIDITRLNGLTSNSERATLAHWRKYVGLLLVASTALWGLAHGLPYLIGR